MAIQIYAKGNQHVVRGVACNVKNVREDSVKMYLDKGWVSDPSELKVEEVKEAAPPKPPKPKIDVETLAGVKPGTKAK